MKQRLLDHIASISNPALRRTCEGILTYPGFFTWPASLSFHHAYEGGLLAHTVEVCDTSLGIARALTRKQEMTISYMSNHREVIIAAALWHDLMKIEDYVKVGGRSPHDAIDDIMPEAVWQRTDYGKTIGHIAGSAAQFQVTAVNHGVERKIIDAVVHCILAHHGRKEWGSPVEPQTLEALILHQADMLSAKFGATKEVAP